MSPTAYAAESTTSIIYPDASDPYGNTGDNGAPLPEDILVPPVPNAAKLQAKLLAATNMQPYVVAEIGGVDAATLSATCRDFYSDTECGQRVPPTSKSVPGYVLYKQNTSYTCAPTAARSVLRSLNGSDPGEMTLASEMKTSSARGTTWTNISPVLNRRQSYDYFAGEPEYGKLTFDEFTTRVVYDIWVGGNKSHGAILNVDQSRLSYWNRTSPGRHYLSAYAYNNPAKSVTLADTAGSHYGSHTVAYTEAYSAVLANKGLVIW